MGYVESKKMVHAHNTRSTLRIFLNDCIMKWAKKYMKSMVFPKKMFLANGPFLARRWCSITTLDPLLEFLI